MAGPLIRHTVACTAAELHWKLHQFKPCTIALVATSVDDSQPDQWAYSKVFYQQRGNKQTKTNSHHIYCEHGDAADMTVQNPALCQIPARQVCAALLQEVSDSIRSRVLGPCFSTTGGHLSITSTAWAA